jgi:serine/threonine-protein kinase
MSLEVGQVIEGKYRITRLIGEGGMGAVYEGENVRIARRVAIKVLHQAYTGSAEALQRFEREAQAAGRIGSDHILEVIDLGALPDGDRYMVMEFLEGEPLAGRIQRLGKLTPQQAAPLIRQLLKGLQAAHDAGIVHRDLKPDNVFVLREKAGVPDYVKIIDFGISKFQPLSGDGMKMTRTGAVMGTPYYMSPEQASGSREADHRSDLYAVGVILYEAVTGRVPFDGETFNQLMFKIVLEEPPHPHAFVPDLDPAFASLILRAMARDVNHRFQTATEFVSALDAWSGRGSAVSLPPPADVSALLPRGAQASFAGTGAQGVFTQSGLTGTKANWATSQRNSVVLPKRSAAPLLAVLGVFGLLLAGGVSTAAYFAMKTDLPAAAASAPPSAAELAHVAEAPKPSPDAPASVTPAAPSSSPAEGAAVAASPKGAATGPVAAAAANTGAPRAAPRPAAPRSGTGAAPTPQPAARPTPASGGNTDFGY